MGNDRAATGTRPTRRAVLAAGAGSLAVTWVGGRAGPASAGTGQPAPGGRPAPGSTRSLPQHPAVRAAFGFLDQMMDAYPAAGPLRLPQSYSDQVGLYATAFCYDAALATLAYLADDRPESLDRARALGDALVYAQEHDPDWADGRLRQAYNVGPYTTRDGVEQPHGFVRPDGTVNTAVQFGFTGSGTGDLAWAGLALTRLARAGWDQRYLRAAVRLGEWVVRTCGTDAPLGGYRAGTDRAGAPLRQTATEHNAVLAGWFDQLHDLTGDAGWRQRRQVALDFLGATWEPAAGFFHFGSADGRSVADFPVTADTQTLGQLAVRAPDRAGCLDWLADQLSVTDTASSPNSALGPGQTATGITFSDYSTAADPDVPIEPGLPRPDPDAVWLEGTGQLGCALLDRSHPGDLDAAFGHLNTLALAQRTLGAGQSVGGRPLSPGSGVVAASSPLHTGLLDSGYYPCRHVAATGWFILAATSTNPFRVAPSG